jgi:hypothetical protein
LRSKQRHEATNLSGVLDEIETRAHESDSDPFTLGDIIEAVGRRSYGPLLLVIGLFAISPATIVPGMTWLAAALTLIVAGQMLFGMKRLWLPRKALKAKLPREASLQAIDKTRPWAKRIDSVLKPRLIFLSQPPFVNVVALFVIAAALITFPMSLVPLAPLAPGFAVVFFGLGMVARDGLWLLLGAAALAGAFWLLWMLIF